MNDVKELKIAIGRFKERISRTKRKLVGSFMVGPEPMSPGQRIEYTDYHLGEVDLIKVEVGLIMEIEPKIESMMELSKELNDLLEVADATRERRNNFVGLHGLKTSS
ncbi:MAG: hypothetical protein AAB655_02425 [Patescibacteria group bacterium]|mgnify:CR=1 FL=1